MTLQSVMPIQTLGHAQGCKEGRFGAGERVTRRARGRRPQSTNRNSAGLFIATPPVSRPHPPQAARALEAERRRPSWRPPRATSSSRNDLDGSFLFGATRYALSGLAGFAAAQRPAAASTATWPDSGHPPGIEFWSFRSDRSLGQRPLMSTYRSLWGPRVSPVG
jgi:hypothetical protein